MKKKRLFLIFSFIVSQTLTAGGLRDTGQEYRSLLEETFRQVVFAVESGDLTSLEGKNQLSRVREKFHQPYNDEYGILESLIDQVGEHYLTASDAQFHFSLLQKDKLMEYRRESQTSRTGTSDSKNHETNQQSGGDRESGSGGSHKEEGGEQRKGNS